MASPYYLEALKQVYPCNHPKIASLCEGLHVRIPCLTVATIQTYQSSELVKEFSEYFSDLKFQERARRNSCCHCNRFCVRYNHEDVLQGRSTVQATPCCASLLHFSCIMPYLWLGKCPRCETAYWRCEIATDNEQLHVPFNRAILRAENGVSDSRSPPSLARIFRSAIPSALRR